jgi:hypothetical protein
LDTLAVIPICDRIGSCEAMPMDQAPPRGACVGPDVLEVDVALKMMGLDAYIGGFAAQPLTGIRDLVDLDATGW